MIDPAARVRNTTLTASLVKPCPTQVPTKVGPPPISASDQQERPARAARVPGVVEIAGQRGDDPEALGGVVQCEADDQHGGERDLAAGRRLPDRQSFGEVVQSDADRDQQRQPAGRRPAARRRGPAGSLGDRHGARAAPPGPRAGRAVEVRS